MKHLIVTIILTILFFVSCQKLDDVEILQPGKMTNGRITAKLNNKDWLASASAYYEVDKKHITIIANTYFDKEATFETERFTTNIPNNFGKFKKFINSPGTPKVDEVLTLYSLMEDDVPLLNFKLDTNKSSNYLEVNALDSTHIAGTFDLTFKALTNDGKKELIYHFQKGNFDVKIVK
jgi:hypothetical protein